MVGTVLKTWSASYHLIFTEKSVYSEIFTYFLEERGHWSALSLKADMHELFKEDSISEGRE